MTGRDMEALAKDRDMEAVAKDRDMEALAEDNGAIVCKRITE